MDWVTGWDLPGLDRASYFVSLLTGAGAGAVYGVIGIAGLLVLRKFKTAVYFSLVGGVVAIVAVLGDQTLGEWVGPTRPTGDNPVPAFPSGHVFGSSVFFGFAGFLAVYYGLRKRYLVPLLALFSSLILAVGPARIYEQAHYPSDVAAGYLLSAFWLLLLIPGFLVLRKTRSTTSGDTPDLGRVLPPGSRVERSIASEVVLDPVAGTATKVYRPPAVVRLLYWVAFQAPFPYEYNLAALQASSYRRKIAGLLTRHRFGKDLVAPVNGINFAGGRANLVTEYVPGEKVENDDTSKAFLAQVSETFARAGLSVWQINPRNPHAHTNLIRNPDGDLKIIDLESALVTPIPAPGQWRSSMKSGYFPIFDDIDFPRLRGYISTNETALEASLGPDGLSELWVAVVRAEAAVTSWKDGELRIWGRLAKMVYRLMDWRGAARRLSQALEGADKAAQTFLERGVQRWEAEGRLNAQEADTLRVKLASNEAQEAIHHLGAHLVLTVLLRFPFGSIGRFAWTLGFWGMHQLRGLSSRSRDTRRASNVHSPLVMVLSLVPGFGAAAYLAAGPLRSKLLVRLMMDQTASKLPFRLYERLSLSRLLAPSQTAVAAGASGPGNKTVPVYVTIGREKPFHDARPVPMELATITKDRTYPVGVPGIAFLAPDLMAYQDASSSGLRPGADQHPGS